MDNDPTKPSLEPPSGTPRKPPAEPPGWRRWTIPLAVFLVFWAAQSFLFPRGTDPTVEYGTFYGLVDSGKVERVELRGRTLTGVLREEQDVGGKRLRSFATRLPAQEDRELLPLMRARGVAVAVQDEEKPVVVRVLIQLAPWILVFGVWMWLSRRAQKAMGAPGGLFGNVLKGRARRFSEETDVRVRFDDVAGLATAKRDLREVVEFLKHPEAFQTLGAHVPHGILLVGPPGTGKTLLARAVAGEAAVPFFSISGSEFIELFVGVGASRVRELFDSAKKVAPAIVFIDEIDAVGRSRGTGLGGGHDEREQTLNQLLSEMDGFARNDKTIVLAATNRPDVLDAALLRPGRFDRRVVLERPERAARDAILRVHTRGKPLAADARLDEVAAATPGFSGADLANLVNEAALIATRRGATAIAQRDFWEAEDKIVVGDPTEAPLSPDEKRRVAVHESGHAIVAHLSPLAEAVRRVSILPRGLALGATMQVAGEDRHIATRSDLVTKLRVLMGGYAAEQLVFGEPSTGAQDDLRRATAIAYDMVAHYGMSEAIGPMFHEQRTEHPFLGSRLALEGSASDATVALIDREAQRALRLAAEEARSLLAAHRLLLDRLAAALVDEETVERERLDELLAVPIEAELTESAHPAAAE